jgi:hypothetical protein
MQRIFRSTIAGRAIVAFEDTQSHVIITRGARRRRALQGGTLLHRIAVFMLAISMSKSRHLRNAQIAIMQRGGFPVLSPRCETRLPLM